MSTIAPDEVRADPDSGQARPRLGGADHGRRPARSTISGLARLRAGRARNRARGCLRGGLPPDRRGPARLGAPSRSREAGDGGLVRRIGLWPWLSSRPSSSRPAAAAAIRVRTPPTRSRRSRRSSRTTAGREPRSAIAGVVPDFALTDHEGERVRVSDLRGKIVLLTFLYTQCPDICPLMADNLNAALLELDPRSARGRARARRQRRSRSATRPPPCAAT